MLNRLLDPSTVPAEHTQLTDTLKGLHSKHTLGAVLRAPPHPNSSLVEWVSTALRAVLGLCRPLEIRVLGCIHTKSCEFTRSPTQALVLKENTTETAHSDELFRAFWLHAKTHKRSFLCHFPLSEKEALLVSQPFNINLFRLTPCSHVLSWSYHVQPLSLFMVNHYKCCTMTQPQAVTKTHHLSNLESPSSLIGICLTWSWLNEISRTSLFILTCNNNLSNVSRILVAVVLWPYWWSFPKSIISFQCSSINPLRLCLNH